MKGGTGDEFRTHTELDPDSQADATTDENYKRVYLRVEFASETSESEQEDTMDQYFDDAKVDGLGGFFVTMKGNGWMPTTLEGKASDVDDLVDEMQADSQFQTVTVLRSQTNAGRVYPDLSSHTNEDTRDSTQ